MICGKEPMAGNLGLDYRARLAEQLDRDGDPRLPKTAPSDGAKIAQEAAGNALQRKAGAPVL